MILGLAKKIMGLKAQSIAKQLEHSPGLKQAFMIYARETKRFEESQWKNYDLPGCYKHIPPLAREVHDHDELAMSFPHSIHSLRADYKRKPGVLTNYARDIAKDSVFGQILDWPPFDEEYEKLFQLPSRWYPAQGTRASVAKKGLLEYARDRFSEQLEKGKAPPKVLHSLFTEIIMPLGLQRTFHPIESVKAGEPEAVHAIIHSARAHEVKDVSGKQSRFQFLYRLDPEREGYAALGLVPFINPHGTRCCLPLAPEHPIAENDLFLPQDEEFLEAMQSPLGEDPVVQAEHDLFVSQWRYKNTENEEREEALEKARAMPPSPALAYRNKLFEMERQWLLSNGYSPTS